MKFTYIGERPTNPDIILWHLNDAIQTLEELHGMFSFVIDGCSPADEQCADHMKYRCLSSRASQTINGIYQLLYGGSNRAAGIV